MKTTLLLSILIIAGCDSDFGEPKLAPGQAPVSGRGTLLRYQKSKYHSAIGRIDKTMWGIGDDIRTPEAWINCLIQNQPDELQAKLQSHLPNANGDATKFPIAAYFADATILSVEPYLMVVAVRENTGNGYPFLEFDPSFHGDKKRFDFVRAHREFLTSDSENRIRYHTGDLFPYSDTMYWVSCDGVLDENPIVLGQSPVIFKSDSFNFVFSRQGDNIFVDAKSSQ